MNVLHSSLHATFNSFSILPGRMGVRYIRRIRVPSKHGNNQYYKGSGNGSTGKFIGRTYILDESKIRKFAIPNILNSELKPYVSHTTKKAKSQQGYSYIKTYIDNLVNKE